MRIRIAMYFFTMTPATASMVAYWKWFSIESQMQVPYVVICFLLMYMMVFWRIFIKGLKEVKIMNEALEKHKQGIS